MPLPIVRDWKEGHVGDALNGHGPGTIEAKVMLEWTEDDDPWWVRQLGRDTSRSRCERSGRVVEELAGRTDSISRGDSRGTTRAC